MKFPCTLFEEAESISIPSPPLPEMTLPSPVFEPPIKLPDAKNNLTPVPVFGTAAVPAALVPMKLP